MTGVVHEPVPARDRLQESFTPAIPEEILDFTGVHHRFPVLADFAARLGGTPLCEAPSRPGGATILAKCEWENPIGSVKDRVAYALLCDALRRHGDRPVGELGILEYSGGNLADALSYLGAEIGLRTRFVVLSVSAPSLLATLRSRGAVVDLVDVRNGFLETIRTAQRIAEDGRWTLLFQHVNPVNLAFHEHTTGRELVRQLAGREPHTWVASIGSGGTLVGVFRALRAAHPGVRAVGVTPAEAPYGGTGPPNSKPVYEGSGGHGWGIRQPFVKAHDDVIHEHRHISFEDAQQGMLEYHELTGQRIGSSAAANWLVAREVAATLPPRSTVVTVFPSAGTPEQWQKLMT